MTENDYVELPVHGGYKTKVDPDVAEKLKNKKLWFSDKKRVRFHIFKKTIALSRYIMNFPSGLIVDHISGDTLDNRRCNLRVCDYDINRANSHTESKSVSGFKGVYLRSLNRKCVFEAACNLKKSYTFLGNFFNALIASLVRDDFLTKSLGNQSGQNFSNYIEYNYLKTFLESTKGRIFRCWFVKRSDGAIRSIICRTGVHKNLKNKGLCYNSNSKNLFLVYDCNIKNYRFIPLENILCIRFNHKNYKVVRERKILVA
jgi:hypothetical protein